MKFHFFDLDLDPMILVLKLDLDIIKMYLCTENEVPSFSGSKVADTQTDSTEIITYPHMRMVNFKRWHCKRAGRLDMSSTCDCPTTLNFSIAYNKRQQLQLPCYCGTKEYREGLFVLGGTEAKCNCAW